RHPDNCPRTLSNCNSGYKRGDRKIAIFQSAATAQPVPEHSPGNPSTIPPLHPGLQKQNSPRCPPPCEPAHSSRDRNRAPLRIPPSPSRRHHFRTSIRDTDNEIASRNLLVPLLRPRRDAGTRCKTSAARHLLRAPPRSVPRPVPP